MENALIAGFSAASASLFGKLTFGGQALSQLSAECLSPSDPTATTVSSSLPAVRWSRCWVAVIDNRWELVMGLLLPLTMMILSNVAMWTFHSKALTGHRSSVEVTAVNAGANFCFAALMGWVVFGETTGYIWLLGSVLIVCGTVLVLRASQSAGSESSRSKRYSSRPDRKRE